jgi:hypothetical protein
MVNVAMLSMLSLLAKNAMEGLRPCEMPVLWAKFLTFLSASKQQAQASQIGTSNPPEPPLRHFECPVENFWVYNSVCRGDKNGDSG